MNAATPSKATRLRKKYLPFVGERVVVTAPHYKALRETGPDDEVIRGVVLGLAKRVTGPFGITYDMVISTTVGLKTIALGRILTCRLQGGDPR